MSGSKLANFYSFAAQHRCLVHACHEPVELHHVHGGISLKTRLTLPRRNGLAEALVVPLCAAHHRTGLDSAHAMGDDAFERFHGFHEGYLLGFAASLLAAYVTGVK